MIKRNNGCPNHGYHIQDSLVKYTGYCSYCKKFWRFRRAIEVPSTPYFWYYFEPKVK